MPHSVLVMPVTLDQVDTYLRNLPAVTVGAKWGNTTWMVGDKGFAWQRPLSKADIKRFGDAPLPVGDLLAVRVENLDAKDALLAIAPPGFFTIQHFQGYPAVLIELRKARIKDVRAVILAAHQLFASALEDQATARRRASPAQRTRAKRP